MEPSRRVDRQRREGPAVDRSVGMDQELVGHADGGDRLGDAAVDRPAVAGEEPVRSTVIRSPAISTRTFTSTGSSPTPSLSRYPSLVAAVGDRRIASRSSWADCRATSALVARTASRPKRAMIACRRSSPVRQAAIWRSCRRSTSSQTGCCGGGGRSGHPAVDNGRRSSSVPSGRPPGRPRSNPSSRQGPCHRRRASERALPRSRPARRRRRSDRRSLRR